VKAGYKVASAELWRATQGDVSKNSSQVSVFSLQCTSDGSRRQRPKSSV